VYKVKSSLDSFDSLVKQSRSPLRGNRWTKLVKIQPI
jgi:hypothetical protein